VSERGHDVYSGHLYVFSSRRGDRIRILTWDAGGFVLYYKRLERGRFRLPELRAGQVEVELEARNDRDWSDRVASQWAFVRPKRQG
jgi:transposase